VSTVADVGTLDYHVAAFRTLNAKFRDFCTVLYIEMDSLDPCVESTVHSSPNSMNLQLGLEGMHS
jgi:hypothetical protein